MSEWRGVHNPERHSFWTTTIQGNVWCNCTAANCGPCAEHFPCRCCLEAEVERLTAVVERVRKACNDPYVGPPTTYGRGFEIGYNDALTIVRAALRGES